LVLLAALVTAGLSAGLFCTFSYAVMPGLRRSGDRGFVEVMQQLNKAILNGWFVIVFLGPLVFTVATVVLLTGADGPVRAGALPWTVGALVLYLLVLGVTFTVNVPLNNKLEAAGPVERIADPGAVRERFETRWVRWNVFRAIASTGAFVCLVVAVLHYARAAGTGNG
jgi:uncharacterized membrane protein